ncbi:MULTISPECIES: efflux RND transporter permease subunit [Methanoculleus]|uniref:Efflux transporter, putative, hydrophobe/amphiphile efflux-3 (HAE3) family n=2 Tax=Methanoculleus TaxID=45989 RepID=A3CTY4_METMJ|nr:MULTISPECIES: hydrophobe/amphiphile efflux-3 (HAE3) family transporter [Methanoculleus]ABN56834.1 efflux transporter, putative, hydrophobe/amphiphile efflux-3 (HAE3) family [Methanoculleus marisnigri JR1]MCC7556603.1 hydrophobe/amphiphile efflux-3 (HAE3) family transporter [Methanoculleus marisnigri]UYU18262.1 hydrophobe/amphiphile efflux-3 (HAE3) family transporter [Methanoculleus submarinus]
MKAVFSHLGRFIAARPYLVAGLVVSLLVFSAYGASSIRMETGIETFVDTDSPEGILLDGYTREFGTDLVFLIVESDNVRDPALLRYVDTLGADIADERYVTGTRSLPAAIRSVNGGRIPGTEAEVVETISRLPQEARARYVPLGTMTLLFVTLEPDLSDDARSRVLDTLETIVSISAPPPGVTVSISGDPVFDREMREAMSREMGMLIAIALVLMVAAIGLLFNHVRHRFLPVGIILCGVFLTFGTLGFFDLRVTSPVIGSFPVIIGLGIDYGVQLQSRLHEEIRDRSLHDAIVATLSHAGSVHLVAMCTTALGFLALLFSPVPMIRDFGTACLIGVVSCFLLAIIIVPAFFAIFGYGKRAGGRQGPADAPETGALAGYSRFLGGLAVRVAKHPVPVILLFALVAVAGMQYDDRIGINVDQQSFVPETMPARVTLEKVERAIGGTSTVPVMIRGSDILDPEILEWIDAFGTYETERRDEITAHTGIATLIREYNGGSLPGSATEIDAVVARIPAEVRDAYLSGNSETVIEFATVDMEMDAVSALIDRLRSDVVWLEPPAGLDIQPTGRSTVYGDLYDGIVLSKNRMTVLGLLLIAIFMVVVYRRFDSLAPLLPVVMIIGWNNLIMYALDIAYTPLTACLGSMTIGLAMDYTILILERCREEMGRGLELYEAIREGVTRIGIPITISGLTTIFGFSSMLASSFSLVSGFGQTTVITIFFSLVGGIIVMPAVVALVLRRAPEPSGHRSGAAAET